MLTKKVLIPFAFVASALWLLISCVLAERFNIPSADGVMYSLPLAKARSFFVFGVPFLDNFDGYGAAWGHQWPGSMWLKSLVFHLVPYSRTADVALLSVFQLLAALSASFVVWKATLKWWASAATLTLIVSDRLLVLSCAGNRFESIAVSVVILLFVNSARDPDQKHMGWRWLSFGLAFICPTLHPYALGMGAIIIGYDCITEGLQKHSSSRESLWLLFAFGCGCAAMVASFITQPEALKQFTTNLALQKTFYQNWNGVIEGLKQNYRIGGGIVLWGAGLLASGMFIFGWPSTKRPNAERISTAWRFLAPTLFIAVLIVHTVTRCVNFTYLAFGSPFAVMMICVTAARMYDSCRSCIRWVPITVVLTITAMHGLLIPYRIFQFKQAAHPNVHAELAAILSEIPQENTIYIPHLFWATAIQDTSHKIRWSSFPIASSRITRERYELSAYAGAKPGDTLIIDNSAAREIDRFGVHPTFKQLPPDPSKWLWVKNREMLFPGSIPWGMDLSIYKFR